MSAPDGHEAVREHWRRDALHRPLGDVLELGDAQAHSTGIAVPQWNGLLLRRPPRDPEALYARAAAWFADRGTPYGVLVPDDVDEEPPGGTRLHHLTALARPLDGLPPLPDRAWGTGTPQEVARVQADAFGDLYDVDLAFVEPVADAPWRHTVVLRDDVEAVATACVVVLGPTALVFDVAVLPDRQRQGLGRAVTLWCLHRAAELGAQRVRLDPTPQGSGLYAALGFLPAPGWTVWRPG